MPTPALAAVRRPEDTVSVRMAVRPMEGAALYAELNQVSARHDIDALTGAPVVTVALYRCCA